MLFTFFECNRISFNIHVRSLLVYSVVLFHSFIEFRIFGFNSHWIHCVERRRLWSICFGSIWKECFLSGKFVQTLCDRLQSLKFIDRENKKTIEINWKHLKQNWKKTTDERNHTHVKADRLRHRSHPLLICCRRNSILVWYRRVNCLQFQIHRNVTGIHDLCAPAKHKYIFKWINWKISRHLWTNKKRNQKSMSHRRRLTLKVFKHSALDGVRGSRAATRSHTLITPSYAPLTIRFLSKRMQRTNCSWPSRIRRQAPFSMSHTLKWIRVEGPI